MRSPTIAEALAKGLLAGFAGTVVMTISSTLEARISGRGASTTPADAVEELLDVEPRDEDAEQRLNTLAHWGYGVSWGVARGMLGAAGLRGLATGAAHFGALWVVQQSLLPALGVVQPTWRYGGKALATDGFHHAVYAVATTVAYEWIDGRWSGR